MSARGWRLAGATRSCFGRTTTQATARLFALDREGARAPLTVTGARARDWEDLAAGPGPDGTPCLFIGDIGNNSRQRTDLVVYCIPEPVLPAEATELASEPAVAYPFRYPGDSPDCEALLVHPQTGALYLIAKDTSGKPEVYRFPTPLQLDHPVTLERVGSLRLEAPSIMGRMVTGGDIAPDGKRLVLRTYLTVLGSGAGGRCLRGGRSASARVAAARWSCRARRSPTCQTATASSPSRGQGGAHASLPLHHARPHEVR